MPPRMMTGMSRPQKASLKAFQRSFPLALGRRVSSFFLPSQKVTAMSAAPMTRPGSTPAIKRSPMEVSLMEP